MKNKGNVNKGNVNNSTNSIIRVNTTNNGRTFDYEEGATPFPMKK